MMVAFTALDFTVILLVFIVGTFSGYLYGYKKAGNTSITPLQIFGMCAFLLYFIAAVGDLLDFNEVTLSIILTFIGGEKIGELLKEKLK